MEAMPGVAHVVSQKRMMLKLMSVLALQQNLVILTLSVNVSADDLKIIVYVILCSFSANSFRNRSIKIRPILICPVLQVTLFLLPNPMYYVTSHTKTW